MLQQTVMAADTNLAEGLALKLRWTERVEKSLMDLEGMRKLTEFNMEGQAMSHLKALMRKTASRCLLLTRREKKFNLRRLHGHAMAQVVSRQPIAAEAWVRARVSPCEICCRQSGTGTGFSPSSSVIPCQYIIPPSLSKLTSSGECVIC
jgi:hypothetical protein